MTKLYKYMAYGLYVSWLWVEIVYLNWCVQTLHRNIESLLVFDVIWKRWRKQDPSENCFSACILACSSIYRYPQYSALPLPLILLMLDVTCWLNLRYHKKV